LKPEAKDRFQASVDDAYDMFVAHVAKNRINMSEEAVRATEAGTFNAEKAIELGLADGIHTLESVLIEAESLSNSPTMGATMPQEQMITKAQSDAMIAEAVASATDKAKAEGVETGIKSEQVRVNSIMSADSYGGREKLAQHLIDQGMSAESAIGILAVSPKEVAPLDAVQTVANGDAQKKVLEQMASENPDVKPDTKAGDEGHDGQKLSAHDQFQIDAVADSKKFRKAKRGK